MPPAAHVIAWRGVDLVPASMLLHWPAGLGINPGQRLVGRLGLDPLNTAWRHRRAAGTAFAASPLRRQRLGMARLTPAMREEA